MTGPNNIRRRRIRPDRRAPLALPGPPGPSILQAPSPVPAPSRTGPGILGMNATTAVIVGLVVRLVIILAIVPVSRGDTTVTRPY